MWHFTTQQLEREILTYPPELLNVSYWQKLGVPAFLHSAHILEKYSC